MKNPKLALLAGIFFCVAGIGQLFTTIYYQQGIWLHYLTAALNLLAGVIILSQRNAKKP